MNAQFYLSSLRRVNRNNADQGGGDAGTNDGGDMLA